MYGRYKCGATAPHPERVADGLGSEDVHAVAHVRRDGVQQLGPGVVPERGIAPQRIGHLGSAAQQM